MGNQDVIHLDPGDVIRIVSGGSGGWGNPFERDPAAVLRDIQRHVVSKEAAKALYGIVLDDRGIDEAATRTLRAARAHETASDGFDFGSGRAAFDCTWNDRSYDALNRILESLPPAWRFFVKHRIFDGVGDTLAETVPDRIDAIFTQLCRDVPALAHARKAN